MRELVLVLVLMSSCAIGRITTPAGVEVEGYAVGNSYLEACTIPLPTDDGPMPKECATLKATTVTSIGEVIGVAIAGAVFYFTGGIGGLF